MEARKWEDDLMDGRSTEHPTERRVHSFGDEREKENVMMSCQVNEGHVR
jgi:hypothetical protein